MPAVEDTNYLTLHGRLTTVKDKKHLIRNEQSGEGQNTSESVTLATVIGGRDGS